MAPDTRIEVEEGAQLIINGAVITSCGEWRGITTRGGRSDFDVKVYNGAIIENTKTAAISMFHPFGGWLLGMGNATVMIDNATFYGCKRMLAMGALTPSFNRSTIANSTQHGGKHGITNWNCLNVKVQNNIFNGQSHDCIHGIDCSFSSIESNEFYSEDTDVWMLESLPGLGSDIKYNVFNGANVGMHLAGGVVGQYLIEENSFRATNFDLFIDNDARYDLKKNDFSADFGVISASNGNSPSDVNSNYFAQNSIGILPFGSNEGYLFRNNCFSTYLVDANINDKIFDYQTDNGDPAGNCFSHQGSLSGVPDIDGDMSHFSYQVPDDDISNCYDALNQSNYSVVLDGQVAGSVCGSSFPSLPERFNPCDFTDHPDEIERNIRVLLERIEDALSNPLLSDAQQERLVAIYKRCLMRNQMMRIKLLVEHEKFEEAMDTYSGMEASLDRQVGVYGLLIASGDISGAADHLQNIDKNSQWAEDFVTIQEINLARIIKGQDYDPSHEVLSEVRTIALKHHPYSAYAKGLLYLFTGDFLRSPIPDYAPEETSLRSMASTTEEDIIDVFPNPFDHSVQVSVSTKDNTPVEYTLSDIMGKTYHQDQTLDGNSIDFSHLGPGVYMLIIKESGKIIHTHRLLKL